MNNTYRLVWNELSNTWVAVAENVKGRGKRSAGALLLTALTGVALAQSVSTQQLPTGGQIVSGSGSITAQGANMTVNQNSARMIANWGSFNIGANAGVKFVQPSANAVALNRIQSQDPTQILGRLTSNGQVMLVNPAGVMFGQGSQVDVGGLVASTLNISDTNFLNGNYRFANNSGTTAGIVSNQGRISTSSGGKLAFLAPVVKNHGLIETPKGSTLLAAAKDITVDFAGDGLISYRVNSEAVNALIENTGIVSVDGGIAVLSAQSLESVTQGVVNNTGMVRAQRLENRDGRIVLKGQGIHQAGNLSANQVGISASDIFEQTINASINADGGLMGNGGTVRIEAGDKVVFSGGISANGVSGGNITLVAPEISVLSATLQAKGLGEKSGNGGMVRIGGGFQGKDTDLKNAQRTRVLDSTLDVSSTKNGNAGKAIVWSDTQTIFDSTIIAKGGAEAGNGGLVEVSSKEFLSFAGRVNASAANGINGQLLLDPKDITIGTTVSGAALGNPLTDFSNTPAGASNIAASDIESILSGGTALTLQANNDITLNNDIVSTNSGGSGAGHLTLQAGRSILLKANITTANGNVTLIANDPNAVVSNRAAGLAHIEMISTSSSGYSTIDAGSGDINISISAANAASISVSTDPSVSGRNTTADKLANGITLGLLKGKNITVRNDQLTTGASSSRPLGIVDYYGATVEATGDVRLQASNGIIFSNQISTDGSGIPAASVAQISLLARDDLSPGGSITNSDVNGGISLKAGRSISVSPAATSISTTNGGDITLTANSPYDATNGVASTRGTGNATISITGQVNASDANGTNNGNVTISMGSGTNLSNFSTGLITLNNSSVIKGRNVKIEHAGTGTTTGVLVGGTIQALGLWDTTPSTPTLTTTGAIDIAANNGSITTQTGNIFLKGSDQSTAVIRAKDDITVSGPIERNTVSGSGVVGELKLLSGGSINLNGIVTTNNSPFVAKANYFDASDSVSDTRSTLAAGISMSTTTNGKINAGTGSIDLRVLDGANGSSPNTSGSIALRELIGGDITVINDGNVLGSSNITSSLVNIAATGNVLLKANKGSVTVKGITTDGTTTAGASINVLAMDDITSTTNAISNSAANGNISLTAGRSITSSNHINSTNGGGITIQANSTFDPATSTVSNSRTTGTGAISITGDVVAANGTYSYGPVDISIGNRSGLTDTTSGTLSVYGVQGKTISITSDGTTGTGISLNRTLRAFGIYNNAASSTTTPGTTSIIAKQGGITALSGASVSFQGSEGNTVVLRARDDITFSTSFVDRQILNGTLPAGEMKLLAGRSVLFNSEFQATNSPLTIKANFIESSSPLVSSMRLPGASVITMGGSTGSIRNATNVNISIMDGTGLSTTDSSAITTGAITLREIPKVVNLTVSNNGSTAGSGVIVGSGGLGINSTGGTTTERTGAISGLINISTTNGDITLQGNIATSNTSSGAITLVAGSTTSAPNATGGDIVVTGSRILTTGTGGSALLFAGSSSGSTGLSALATSANTYYNVDPTHMPSSGVTTGVYALFRQDTMPLTITIANASMNYGDTYPTFPSYSITSGTLNAGDSISSIAWGTAATAYKAQGTYPYSTTNLVVPTFTCNGGGSTCVANYSLTFANNLTINRRPITVTADAKNTVYGGVEPSLTYQITAGNVVNNDPASGVLSRASGSHANTYAISQNTLSYGGNYQITYVPANLTIAPAVLTVSLTNTGVTKTYDGTYHAPVGFTPNFAVTGQLPGDTVSIFYSAAGYNAPHVLAANKVTTSPLSISGVAGTNGSLSTDYVLSATSAFVPATITPAVLTVSNANINGTLSKVYDGTNVATGASISGSISGAISGDTLSFGTNGMTLAYNSPRVVGATTISASGAPSLVIDSTTSGSLASDYSFTPPVISDVAGSITPKALTSTASIGGTLTKTYDGTLAAPAATVSGSVTGAISGDTLSVDTSGVSLAYNNAHVVGASTISATGNATLVIGSTTAGSVASDYSYAAPTVASVNASITPKALTPTASIGGTLTKTYDGTLAAPAATVSGSVTGAISGDTLSVDTSGVSLAYNNAHVVGASTISATGNATLVIGSSTAGSVASDYSYAAPTVASVNASITPKILTATLTNTDLSKPFDGTLTPPLGFLPQFTVAGFVSGDNATALTGNSAYNSSEPTTANSILVSDLKIESISGSIGSRNSDYRLDALEKSVPAKIIQLPPAITPEPQSKAITTDIKVPAKPELSKDKELAVAAVAAAVAAIAPPEIKIAAVLSIGTSDMNVDLVVTPVASSLTIADGVSADSKNADDGTLKTNSVNLFTQTGDDVAAGGALSIVEQGRNIRASSTTTTSAQAAPSNLNLGGMRFVNVDYRLPSGGQNQMTVGVSSDGVLVVKVPAAMKAASDDRSLALIGMATAKERLDVQPANVKGVVIQVE